MKKDLIYANQSELMFGLIMLLMIGFDVIIICLSFLATAVLAIISWF